VSAGTGAAADAPPASHERESTPLPVIIGRLFESELGSLEALVVSRRAPDGVYSLDGLTALGLLLSGEDPATEPSPADPVVVALHHAMLTAWPDLTCAVSGLALHLRDLFAEGVALPEPTSMMRKRGVTRLADHVVEPSALEPSGLGATLARARALAEAKGMKHILIILAGGMVHVAGRAPEESMAHWSNVEFSARVEVMRVEEALVRALSA
jgi:hypothetical protein